ncbi:acylneuraminate cytidylyltransferase family protein [Cohnella pontilimi]|uniref:Acylneuraminate cytidylyltransferase family protein n=1 Tax=Cohnella pontilimi TaxID=2564100 RepID=A0A4U0FB98_9BACL|nr:acylneuraminate cytidylyltransferase family protein [Cohnella pontilimi]TJY41967.1 acylneuraminate cytidylyltransferase family protein [Cohnella pontilimi]
MIAGRSVLAVITARGGSKGVLRKNIHPLAGKPLISWTIECAKASRYIDRCIISTEDSEIAAVSREWGGDVPFLRPEELAKDDTPGVEPVLHAASTIAGYDLIVLLQPTSPLRKPDDIEACLETLVSSNATSCVTVTQADKSPLWMYNLDETGGMMPVLQAEDRSLPRQKLAPVYVLNGAVYALQREHLMETKKLLDDRTLASIMPRERSLDIDTWEDFEIAELRIRKMSMDA